MSKKLSATDFICDGKKECLTPCFLSSKSGWHYNAKSMLCILGCKNVNWRRVEIEEKQAVECPEVITENNINLEEIPNGFREVEKGKVKHGDVLDNEKGIIEWAWGLVGLAIPLYGYKVYRKTPDKKRMKA